jgi:alkylation response protein AidB-like acyl-CoA dehydrogenase
MSPENERILGPDISVVGADHPFRRELRTWLNSASPRRPEPRDQDEKFRFRRDWQRLQYRDGWAGTTWPAQYGGRDAGPIEQFIYHEEMALARAPEMVNTPGIILFGPTLMIHGTPQLCERFLPGILSGDDIWCQGFSEPDSGSDLASVRTSAHLDGDEWVITGHKIWTTWAAYADLCFVLCRTEQADRPHEELSLLICRMDQPGVTTRPIHQISGDSEFGEVFFDEVRTPKDLIVGGRGDGWKVAMTMFEFERGDQGFTDHTRLLMDLAEIRDNVRVLHNANGMNFASRWAQLWIRCQQLRRLNLRNAVGQGHGVAIGPGGSAIKLFWSELTQAVAELRLDVAGTTGRHLREDAAYQFLASRATSIYSGTNEIQRNIVAERILQLPR